MVFEGLSQSTPSQCPVPFWMEGSDGIAVNATTERTSLTTKRAKQATPSRRGGFVHFQNHFSTSPSHASRAGISIIPQPQQFVNRQTAQKIKLKISRFCATLPLAFCYWMCYTIIVKRECGESADQAQRTKKFKEI